MSRIKEIQRIDPIPEDKFGYDKFVTKSASDAEKIKQEKEEFQGTEFLWSESKNGKMVRIIAYDNNEPIGYLALKKFKDAWKVYTIGVRPMARGKGIASKLYDYAISKTKLYSDTMETPAMRKLWTKIYKNYDISGLDMNTGKTFEIEANGDELVSKDPNINLYSDKDDGIFLVVQKGLRESRWLKLAGLKKIFEIFEDFDL
jgi:GNAT superfamily N-acetyltransferase